jgi:hypothetical protein
LYLLVDLSFEVVVGLFVVVVVGLGFELEYF